MNILIVLPVTVPLLTAVLGLIFLRRIRLQQWLSHIGALVLLISSILLLRAVWQQGILSTQLGNWTAPFGITFVADLLSALMILITGFVAVCISLYASAAKETERIGFGLYPLIHFLLMGVSGAFLTGDYFNLYVWFEVMLMASFVLMVMGNRKSQLEGGFKYVTINIVSSVLFLAALGLLYGKTGTLNMADLQTRIPGIQDSRPVLAAFAFITVGLALKAALFPMHLWLPNAYAYAPSGVSAFMAATATKVSLYVLLRFTFTIFGAKYAFGNLPLHWVLLVPAVLAMFAGSFSAIFQRDIKRMLAYSSVAQIGYITLAISLASSAGVTAALIHIFNHGLMKAALFCAMGCIFYRISSTRIDAMAGLGRQMPWTMTAIVAGGLSLLGVPLTAGFISKWYLVQAALQSNLWWLVILIALSSMLALVYVWRLVEALYFKEPSPNNAAVTEAPLSMLLPTLLLAGANIYFGIDTRVPVAMAEHAAELLMRGQIW